MPLQATSGAASYDAFGGGVAAVPQYIEDVFSTYLYTGNSSTQTITNGIDLAGKGGLVWRQGRSAATGGMLIDTARGIGSYLISYSTDAAQTGSNWIDSFNSNGFTMNSSSFNGGATYASWTFRKQPKFFDVVTYTGNGANGRTVAHSLGSTPGCIIVKRTDAANGWAVYHRAMNASPQDYMMRLNATDGAFTTTPSRWNNTLPTSTEFTLSGNDEVNGSGATYVAYLFAHNAGGFGLAGTDNVISCGSFTTDGAGNATVNLGYEPQWLLAKRVDTTGNWELRDSMRYWPVDDIVNGQAQLFPNLSNAESNSGLMRSPTATGFAVSSHSASATYIYIAIRRGPMKVPTSGTSVFQPLTRNGTGGATTVTSTVRPDTVLQNWRSGGLGSANHFMYDRLRGVAKALFTDTTDAESTQTATGINAFNNLSYGIAGAGSMNNGSALYADYVFTRAPSFFDVVCYTGNNTTGGLIYHNLGVTPELVIAKSRSNTGEWYCVAPSALGTNKFLNFNSAAPTTYTLFSAFSSTTITKADVGTGDPDASGVTYVMYLFATCAGVSKVGSYTGTGTTQQINCGFTGGARFVMIKRTDSTGSWYVWDVARGISSGNDPYLLLNSTAAEVTNTDYIDAYSAGFEISSTAPAEINASGGSFIFLAIS